MLRLYAGSTLCMVNLLAIRAEVLWASARPYQKSHLQVVQDSDVYPQKNRVQNAQVSDNDP
jgi:hypothetical protein